MTTFDRIKLLAEKRKISIADLERTLGLGINSVYGWKKKAPNSSNLAKVADYFHVTTDYLLGREEKGSINEPFDLADLVDDDKINWDEWVSFDGKPLSDEVKNAMKLILGKRLEN